MNEFEQESHKHASQNRARRPFENIELKLCFFVFFLFFFNERLCCLIRAMYRTILEEIVYRYQKVSFLSINDFSFNFRLCCVFCLFLYNNQI